MMSSAVNTCFTVGCRNHSSRPASTASLLTGKGTSCGPLVCLCYTRVAMHGLKLFRESDRRCPPLAFCPKRISVGRAHHHRKRMYSIHRFRTKLTFRRNILLYGWMPFSSGIKQSFIEYLPNRIVIIVLLGLGREISHFWPDTPMAASCNLLRISYLAHTFTVSLYYQV